MISSIQGIFAHGNKGMLGNETNLIDKGFAAFLIKSHKGELTNDMTDKVKYDWDGCTMTKVRYVEDGDNARFKSTELATKAFVASCLYEAGITGGGL